MTEKIDLTLTKTAAELFRNMARALEDKCNPISEPKINEWNQALLRSKLMADSPMPYPVADTDNLDELRVRVAANLRWAADLFDKWGSG